MIEEKEIAIKLIKEVGYTESYKIALEKSKSDVKWYKVLLRIVKMSRSEFGNGALEERFLVPPFSVINTHRGAYKKLYKKWKQDYAIGINATGRDENLLGEKSVLHGTETVGTSIFNPALAQIAYSWFATKKQSVIFDPFCGGPERGVVASAMGHKYTGIDIREEQVLSNIKIFPEEKCKWINADATVFNYERSDMILTCPPYYNMEIYSNKENDLSNQSSYYDFMKLYKTVIRKCCSSCCGYIVFVVGNIRENQNFIIDFPGDTIKAFEENGFGLHNEIIIYAVGSAMIRTNFKNRKVTNVHQKMLVFKRR